MSKGNKTEYEVQGVQKPKRGFYLTTPMKARKRLAKLLNMHYKEELEIPKFKSLVYGLSKLLEYFKFEKDLEIEKRIIALEEKIERLYQSSKYN